MLRSRTDTCSNWQLIRRRFSSQQFMHLICYVRDKASGFGKVLPFFGNIVPKELI